MRRSSIVAIVIFAAALLALLSIGPQATRKIQATFFQVISPFLKTGSGLERQITSVRAGLKSLEDLEKENAALRVENRSLKATNEALRDVQHEVNRLRHALNYRQRSLFRLVPAEIISRDSSTWWRTVTINRGSEDGIEPEMPVLTDEGLVGRTTTVSESVAVVLLVSDENCRVAASVVEGSLTPMLDLNYLSKQAELKPGQKVYTSGVGGVFPSGLFIGTVHSFKVRALDSQAKLAPAVDLAKLEDVFVVIGSK
jgi:rod shape-determining protein MreC